jgi:hypothetical protein
MKNLIEKYENLGYILTLKNEPMIIGTCVRKVSRARIPNPLFNYRFRSIDRMIEFCTEWINKVEINVNAENERKAKKKEAQKNMQHSYKVGDIIYNSWGYDQTNIDFYQIVEVKAKSIMINRIGKCYVEGTEGFMSSNVKPIQDDFIGEPILKKVNILVNYNGNIQYYIKAEHGCFVEYHNEKSGVYSSWYA